MRNYRSQAVWTLLGLVTAAACAHSAEQYEVTKLPSGREVRIVSTGLWRFQNGETSLVLTYQTPFKVTDTASLRAEVEDIWTTFRIDAENAQLHSAIISAVEVPSGFVLRSSEGRDFVFERSPDGAWYRLQ